MSVYKITSPSTDLVYYGSSTQPLQKRFMVHKCNFDCSSRQIIQFGDAQIELVETVEDIEQLRIRERFYIENYPCINIMVPGRKQKDYYQTIKKELSEKHKVKVICECGSSVRKSDLPRHCRTKKHKELVVINFSSV